MGACQGGHSFQLFVYVYYVNILHICIVGTPAYCAQFGGGGGQHGGFDALDYRKIKHGNAGPLGTYPILSALPDKFAKFLFEFHSG
jgi:hypothetical protein